LEGLFESESLMTQADQYRVRAAEFAAKARAETRPSRQLEFARMAASYIRLAETADQNATTDVVYETPNRQSPGAR
jgi:hypothetical protein